jgi:transcriptional regulator with XRE-family HTH domain
MRTARQLSLNGLAQRAGVSKRTLSYWESGTYQPCLPELEAVLNALGATAEQREDAVARIGAPRAARHLRQQPQIPVSAEEIGPLPCGGDLLRAMRHRRRLYLEQAAKGAGVSPGTLSRWEQGKVIPPPERLDALLTRLQAHPQERAALTDRSLFLAPPLRETTASVDALRARCGAFLWPSYVRPDDALLDLTYLTFAGWAWSLSAQSAPGRLLLAEIYSNYAAYLAYTHRFAEAGRAADRALDLLSDRAGPEQFFCRAAIASARAQVFRGARPAPQRGLEMLRLWLPLSPMQEYTSWILRDMAEYLVLEEANSEARALLMRACHIAQDCANPTELRLRKLDLARLHLRDGNAGEALPLAVLDPLDTPLRRADIALIWAEGLLALGERSGAQEWLQRACADIQTYDLAHLRPRASALAQRF